MSEDYTTGHDWLKPLTVEVQFANPSPEVLGILTGGVMGEKPADTFSLDVFTPARRRTFWEWLRRKPKHLASATYFPNVRLEQERRRHR